MTCAVLCDGIEDCVVVPGFDESLEKGCTLPEGTTSVVAEVNQKTLSSPNFPKRYINNLDKRYVIEAPKDHLIKLDFTHFFVEECDTKSCWCDYVTIKDGNGQFFKFNGVNEMCGQMCDFSEMQTSTNKVTITFVSDYARSYGGWSLKFWAVTESRKQTKHAIDFKTSCGYRDTFDETDGSKYECSKFCFLNQVDTLRVSSRCN